MKRRDFISLLGGAATAWPLAAHAQQGERMRRVGVLMHVTQNDQDGRARLGAFVDGLKELGWVEGRSVRLDVRWGPDDPQRYPRQAGELVASAPDLLVAPTSFTLAALQRATRSVPIVFVGVIDPVGAGFVSSLARPGGNTTGFIAFEYTIGAKWLELLKEIAPHVTRAAVLRDPVNASGIGQFAAIQAAGAVGIDLSVINLQNNGELDRGIAQFASAPNGGLVVTASPFGANHPDVIARLAARYKLPAVYPFRYFVLAGGLLSYGADLVSQSRPAAAYADRMLKGENPAELPVQAPTKYELVINLNTAKALGLEVPATLLARADEVDRVRRREFITLLGGAAAWPLAGWAQPSSRMRRIGILMYLASDDADAQSRNAAFLQGLQELGWTVGQNVRVDYRWGASNFDPERMRKGAVELVALAPDVVLATTVPIVLAVQQVSRTVPIVFAGAIDPVGAGLVASLARPGGNATGFTNFEYGISAKWLELLKKISPGVKRVAVLREPTVAGIGQLAAMQTAAPLFEVELQPIDARDVDEFERVLANFAGAPNGGLIVPLSTSSETHRTRIIALADRHRLPAVFPSRLFVTSGGLTAYGPDTIDLYRRAAGYVDRILKGEKPADLPVQAPTKYETIINLKTAKALGLEIPSTLLARADEVIE